MPWQATALAPPIDGAPLPVSAGKTSKMVKGGRRASRRAALFWGGKAL